MGDPRKLRKKYVPPKHPWEAERLEHERGLKKTFGLKNKKEIWRVDSGVRKFRYLARSLVGIPIDQRKGEEEKLVGKLRKMGLLKEGSTLDDALSLKTDDLLARRLQTLVWRKGLASTLSQARQLITHGHIAVEKRKVTSPGMIIGAEQENTIDWYGKPVKTTRKVEPTPVEEKKKEPTPEEPKPAEKTPEKEEKKLKEKKPRKPRKKKEEKAEEVKTEAKTNA